MFEKFALFVIRYFSVSVAGRLGCLFKPLRRKGMEGTIEMVDAFRVHQSLLESYSNCSRLKNRVLLSEKMRDIVGRSALLAGCNAPRRTARIDSRPAISQGHISGVRRVSVPSRSPNTERTLSDESGRDLCTTSS